jgi:iron complex transport system ATP-binding protein
VAFVQQRATVGAPFTVRQVVQLGRHSLPSDPQRLMAALELVMLSHMADHAYHSLSTGQQQRVAIARALAQHTPQGLVLLDEALAAVDLPQCHHLVQVIRRLAADGATVVMSTHDLSLAAAIADHVWYLAHGSTVALGPAHDVLGSERLATLVGIPVVTAPGFSGKLPVPDLTAMLRHEP